MKKSVQLTFKRIKEERPKEGMSILYVCAGFNDYELRTGEVYYDWLIIDEKGLDTGSSIVYDENEEQPSDTRLAICVEGMELPPGTYWADPDELGPIMVED
jgi:hypothetical protein